jgi:hypothetical protein
LWKKEVGFGCQAEVEHGTRLRDRGDLAAAGWFVLVVDRVLCGRWRAAVGRHRQRRHQAEPAKKLIVLFESRPHWLLVAGAGGMAWAV